MALDARVVAFTHEIHTTQRAINSSSYLERNNTSDFAKTNKELIQTNSVFVETNRRFVF